MFTRLSNWAHRNMPTREGMEKNKFLRPMAHRFLRSDLWRFNRRSVPRGVALGIFSGFILPVGQIPLAAFLALPLRANVPVSVISTFITNPFTFPFWIWVANRIGTFVLRLDAETHGEPIQTQLNSWMGEWLYWLMAQAGAAAFGMLLLAVVGSALGFVLSTWFWNWWVARKWRGRRTRIVAAKL